MNPIKNWWYFSALRFYLVNTRWNYSFWLNSKKIFEYKEYRVFDNRGFYTGEIRKIRKFIGYEYKGKIYQDNPGFPIIDRELWVAWKKKGLIK